MALSIGARIELWASKKAAIRAFFAARTVQEVSVPCVMPAPVTDPYIDVPQAIAPDGRLLGYLQSSPEYAMKRLLAQGAGDIYCLTPAWRIDEVGRRHRGEFTLLEWYRAGFDGAGLRAETSALLQILLQCPPADEISYRDAFLQHLGFCPFQASDAEIAAALHQHLNYSDPLSRTGALQWLCAAVVEPQLGAQRPVFLTHYPLDQAALARGCVHQGFPCADRFELFYHGVELANGYHELIDPIEQRHRFEADLAQRQREGLPQVPMDEALLEALPQMPDCAGIALGLDRVVMLAAQADSLDAISLFSHP